MSEAPTIWICGLCDMTFRLMDDHGQWGGEMLRCPENGCQELRFRSTWHDTKKTKPVTGPCYITHADLEKCRTARGLYS